MNNTQYTIYWINTLSKKVCFHQVQDIVEALSFMELLRKKPEYHTCIAMNSENKDRVGKDGVDSVENGKTPDGVEYSWVKRRDGGQ